MNSEKNSRSIVGIAVAAIAGVIVAAGISALMPRTGQQSSPSSFARVGLATSGVDGSAMYRSGQRVRLQWTPIRHATSYRLQIAINPGSETDVNAFAHPWKVVTGPSTSYAFRVVGRREYAWRVQAYVHGGWTWFSRSTRFWVAAPLITATAPLEPAAGQTLSPGNVRFCWSPVPAASDYLLVIDGVKAVRTRSSCATVTMPSGAFTWHVAAQAEGARLYTGPSSPRSILFIHTRTTRVAARITHHRQPKPRQVAVLVRVTPRPAPTPVVRAPRHPSHSTAKKPTHRLAAPRQGPHEGGFSAVPRKSNKPSLPARPTPTSIPPTSPLPSPTATPTPYPVAPTSPVVAAAPITHPRVNVPTANPYAGGGASRPLVRPTAPAPIVVQVSPTPTPTPQTQGNYPHVRPPVPSPTPTPAPAPTDDAGHGHGHHKKH